MRQRAHRWVAGVHHSAYAVERDLRAFIDAHNAAPRPFR
jgi:hypothetical protein